MEATPEDILRWTGGAALVAAGSPFMPVKLESKTYSIAQCNNAYISPGIGLGVLASGASQITDTMLIAASRARADCSPRGNGDGGTLLPDINDIQTVSRVIAMAVVKAALVTSEETLSLAIEHNFWQPQYHDYRRTSF